jgi:NTP pyrophosphatase (non-canonical NTP hydrolase)
MNNADYVKQAVSTESKNYDDIAVRLSRMKTIRLLHAGMGIATEAGEFVDTIKKYAFYGKEIDQRNLIEELGDLMWYIALAVDTLGTSLDAVMEKNAAKLAARYKAGFSAKEAIVRNIENEMVALDNSGGTK